MKGGKSYFYTALSAFLILRAFAFSYFSGNYTDSDQCVMWQMAHDFAHFQFHTPFYYGQLYSSGLEAWLAAPFIWVGIPVFRAVPLVTALMSTLPWIWMAQLSIKKHGHHKNATALLLCSMIFPVSWLQTTYISRGFMQSLFLISLSTRFLSSRALSIFFGVILVSWGLIQNANGLLLLPAVLPFWMDSISMRSKRQMAGLLSGAIASVALMFSYRQLIQSHPHWMIHGTINLSFSYTDFAQNITQFNRLLQHSYPFIPLVGILIIGLITWILFQPKSKWEALAFWGTLLSPVGLFGLSKITDGTENIFFGYGRFFLAIPFAWGFLWSNSNLQIPTAIKKMYEQLGVKFSNQWIVYSRQIKYSLFLFFTTVCISGYAYQLWDQTSIREFGKTYIPVMVYPLNQMKLDAAQLANLCKKEDIGAVLILDHFVLECGSMGYSLLSEFPVTDQGKTIPILRPKYERRHWLLQENQNYIPKKVAVMDVWKDSTWGTQWPFKRSLADVRGRVFIFETGAIPLNQFITKFLK